MVRERPIIFPSRVGRPLGRIREEGRACGQAERDDLFLVSAAETLLYPFLSHTRPLRSVL